MKTVIIILFVVLIGFGFLLASNLYMQQDLDETTLEKNRATDENRTLQEQLAAQSRTIDEMNRQLQQLAADKQTLETALQNRAAENEKLSAALAETNDRLTRSDAELLSLQEQLNGLRTTNEYLMAENNTLRSNGYEAANPPNDILIPATGSAADNMEPSLLALSLPAFTVLTCMLNRRIRRRLLRYFHLSRNDAEGTVHVWLTEEERRELIRMRRKK